VCLFSGFSISNASFLFPHVGANFANPQHMLLASRGTTRCLQMPLWLFLAAAALFGTFSSPQHLMQESHPETGRRCVCARRHDPPGRTRARPRAGAPRLSLRANAPPSRAGTGAAAAINARRRALVQKMKGATMADPERSTQSAPSAPIARTVAPGPPCHHNHHQSHLDLLYNHHQSHLDLLWLLIQISLAHVLGIFALVMVLMELRLTHFATQARA